MSKDFDQINDKNAKKYLSSKELSQNAKLEQFLMQKVHSYQSLGHFGDHALTSNDPR